MSTGKAVQFAEAGGVFQADFHRPDDWAFLQRQSVACLIVGDAVLPAAEEDA
jgi:hypothetical protein